MPFIRKPSISKQMEMASRYPQGSHYLSASFGSAQIVAHVYRKGEMFLKLQSTSNQKNLAYLSVLQANPRNVIGGV